MIQYKHFTLDNGLKVYHHLDITSPMAVFNLCYNVGSRNEQPNQTGFAHLFEHLMFTGSVNVPNYDNYIQMASGENNAFTSPDVTNYYITLPAKNIETAFWLESDRMLGLAFDEKGLEVQKKVVIEEYKQRYLNQPFGDAMLELRPLAYKKHPYRWATIGADMAHIENATMDNVRSFFDKYYAPNNAVLVVAGNISFEIVKELSEKYFASISSKASVKQDWPQEPTQTEARHLDLYGQVPNAAIFKAYHNAANYTDTYFLDYVINSILGSGSSSRLHMALVENQKLMTNVQAMHTQSIDTGLFIIKGMLAQNVALQTANQAIEQVLEELMTNGITENELKKVKSKAATILAYSEIELLQRAMAIAFAANVGKIDQLNSSQERLNKITLAQINQRLKELFATNKSNTIFYHPQL